MSKLAWILLAFAAAAPAAPPARILIAYYSETGNTEKLAAAVRDGAATVAGVEVLLRKTVDATPDDITRADGLVVGTPVHWQNLSADAKRFVDRVGEALGKTGKNWGDGRTAGVFCSAGNAGGGQEAARLSVIAAMLAMRFVIIGGVGDEGYGTLGPQAVTGGPAKGVSDRDRAEARRFGERFARITLQLRAGAPR